MFLRYKNIELEKLVQQFYALNSITSRHAESCILKWLGYTRLPSADERKLNANTEYNPINLLFFNVQLVFTLNRL